MATRPKKPAKKPAKKLAKKPAKKPAKKLPRGPQVARAADKALVERARRLLVAFAPVGATDVRIGVSVFRRSKTTFDSLGFVRWVPARGKIDRAAGASGTGDGPNDALDALIEKLERGELR